MRVPVKSTAYCELEIPLPKEIVKFVMVPDQLRVSSDSDEIRLGFRRLRVLS